MRVIDYLMDRPGAGYASMEKPGQMATKSEVRRWCEQGSVLMNGERVGALEEMDFPLISVVLHPKSGKRVTLW